jgi:hypothetical protein
VHERFVEEAGKPVATEEAASEATEHTTEVESLAVIGGGVRRRDRVASSLADAGAHGISKKKRKERK